MERKSSKSRTKKQVNFPWQQGRHKSLELAEAGVRSEAGGSLQRESKHGVHQHPRKQQLRDLERPDACRCVTASARKGTFPFLSFPESIFKVVYLKLRNLVRV